MPDTLVGVVSDTHGKLSEAAVTALAGVDRIIHAGDIGSLAVLDELRSMAPVTAVYGNMDGPDVSRGLQLVAGVTIAGVEFVITHERADLPHVQPDRGRWLVLISGHTHVADVEVDLESRTIRMNPGSPSKGRAGSGRSLARISISDGVPRPRIVDL